MNNTNSTIASIRATIAQLQQQLDQLEKEATPAETKAGKPVFRAEVYLMPEACEIFDGEKRYCEVAAQHGANFGIDYQNEQTIFRCVVMDPGDDQGSWNNDGVPKELAAAMGWKDKVRFPDYLPLTLVDQLAKFDGVSLVLPEATIELVPLKKQGLRYNQSIADVFDMVKAHSCNKYKAWAQDSEAGKHSIETDAAEDWYQAGLICQQLGTVKDASECFHRAAELGSKLAEHKLGWA